MRIPTKYAPAPVKPNVARVVRKFAFLPHRIDDLWVWLEFYEVLQAMRVTEEHLLIDGKKETFTVAKWVDVTERLMNTRHE